MLATAGPIVGTDDEWAYEPKLDGWRAMITVADGRVAVRTRTGRKVTDSVPALASLAEALADREAVLDGELVANAGNPSSFYEIGGRMAVRSPAARAAAVPISFVCFDLLWLDGVDLTGTAYAERRAALEGLRLRGPAWCTAPVFFGLGAEVFASCVELGLEGLVAKRLTGRYRPGTRSPDWVKAKCPDWRRGHAPRRRAT